jgi:PHP family Zn ribbon phosphoesterase
VRLSPEDTFRNNNICPECGRVVTIGVLNRIEALSDRDEDVSYPQWSPPFQSLIPLTEIIGETLAMGSGCKKVNVLYRRILEDMGNEFSVLIEAPLADIESAASSALREAISRVRTGNVHITPGFDGQFGSIRIFTDKERRKLGSRNT